MKSWKTVSVVAVFVVLVVSLGLVARYALQDKEVKAAKARIETFKIVEEEQGLILSILEKKIAVAKINAQYGQKPAAAPAAAPAPPAAAPGAITGMEYIPMDQIPKDAEVSDGLGR